MPTPNNPQGNDDLQQKRQNRESASPFSPGALRGGKSPTGPTGGGGGGGGGAGPSGPIAQDKRHIAIDTKLGKDVVALRSFTATETLSRLFQIETELVSTDFKIKFGDIVGTSATVRVDTAQAQPRFFNGLVCCFRQAGNVGRLARYQAVIVPKLWFLTRSGDCRIYQNQTVPDIIKLVMREQGVDNIEDALTDEYLPWEYCVQYRETDFNFVSRLMEHEGIHYYFKHESGKHTLVLADSGSVHEAFPGYDTVPFRGNERDLIALQSVRQWTLAQEVETGNIELTDFDFKAPRKGLNAVGLALPRPNAEADHTIFDYPGGYIDPNPGARYAGLRVKELQVGFENVYGQGDVRGIAAGRTFTLADSPRADQNREYLVVSTVIHAEDQSFHTETGGKGSGGGGTEFSCSFQARSTEEPFLPARVTPKPTIQGSQTAIVVGPKGEEIFTDKFGRIKVQFHWDRRGKHDENSSIFIRVAEIWAGRRWGATFTPRIGQEVVVNFLEGDPDQPLVIGSVYNGDQMPPYLGEGPDPKHKNDPNVSGVKSCSTKGGQGYNELRFDDTKDKEEVFLHAEKDMDVRIKNDERVAIGNDLDFRIGTKDKGNVTGKILRTLNLWVRKVINLQADDRYFLQVGDQGKYVELITSDGKHWIEAKTEFSYKSGSIVMEAGDICLNAGPSFIKLGKDGIYIKGPMVYINSGGSAASAHDTKYDPPLEPKEADDSKPGSVSAMTSTPPPPPKKPAPKSPASAAAPESGAAAPGVPGAPPAPGVPAMPAPTMGFFNCVKNAAKKAGEAIDQGKKTVDDATKAVKAAVDGAHKVEDKAKAALKAAEKAVEDAKSAVNSAGDTVDHLKKAASGTSVSEVKAAVKSGQDAVSKAQAAVKDAKDAVTKAKEAVDEAVADVKAAIKAAENFVDNVKETVKKTGEAIDAAGQCI